MRGCWVLCVETITGAQRMRMLRSCVISWDYHVLVSHVIMIGILIWKCPDVDVQTQQNDLARHQEIFARYLACKITLQLHSRFLL